MRTFAGAHLIVALGALGGLVAPRFVDGARLPVRSWNQQDGLPGDEVRTVEIDARGFVWVGTTQGLARFDGRRFTSWTERSGLPGLRVEALLEDGRGELWVGTDQGLCRLEALGEPVCSAVGLPGSDGARSVRRLFADRRGRLWVGTADGLFVSDAAGPAAAGFRLVELPERARTTDGRSWIGGLAESADGRIWVATARGLAEIREGEAARWVEVDPGAFDGRIPAIAVDRSERLWITHGDRGLYVWWPSPASEPLPAAPLETLARPGRDAALAPGRVRLPRSPGEVVHLTRADGLPEESLRNGLLETAAGEIWVGTGSSGVCRIADERLTCFGAKEGFPTLEPRISREDRGGNLWLGTGGAGLARLDASRIESFGGPDGFESRQVKQFFEDEDGALVVAAVDRDLRVVLHRFDGSRFERSLPRLPPSAGRGSWGVGQVLVPSPGGFWLATETGALRWRPGGGSARLAEEPPRLRLSMEQGISGLDVYALFEDSAGNLWIGTFAPAGLSWRGPDGQIERLSGARGFPDRAAVHFAEDRGGGVWIAFDDGTLGRAAGGRFERVEIAATAGSVTALHCDGTGRLWVGTAAGGVVRLDRPETERGGGTWFGAEHGLSSLEVRAIVTEPEGGLFLGTARGLDHLDPTSRRALRLTTSDGLPGNVVNLLHRDREGAIWVATRGGLARLRPELLPRKRSPDLWFTALEIAGKPVPVSRRGQRELGPIRLARESDAIRVTVAEPRHADELLEYRLDPGSPWNGFEADATLAFAGFAAGSHQLEIRSQGAPATTWLILRVEVATPFWRRPEGLLLLLVATLLVAAIAHRLRVTRLLAVQRVRAKLAADLHDDLGASLSRIAVLAEVARRELGHEASDARLAEIAETARSVVGSAGDLVWAIDPEADDPTRLAARLREEVVETCESGGVEGSVELEIEPGGESVALGSELRRNLLLVVKEAVRNAVRHARPRQVSVRLRIGRANVTVEVTDDGCGFEAGAAGTAALPAGRGLRNMGRRARELGGELAIASVPGAGTRILLAVPLDRAGRRA